MVEELNKEYIMIVRVKGVSKLKIMFVYMFRNVMIFIII